MHQAIRINKAAFLAISWTVGCSAISLASSTATANEKWEKVSPETRAVYSKFVGAQQKAKALATAATAGTAAAKGAVAAPATAKEIAVTQFSQDLAAAESDPSFRCAHPYRYNLLATAGALSKGAQAQRPDCKVRPIAVHSTDNSVVGTSFAFENLAPENVRRVQIGTSADGRFSLGHSYIKVDLCVDKDCRKPKQIAIHPGSDEDGNLGYVARTYSDMEGAMRSREGLEIEFVDLDLSNPRYKHNFLDALFERLNESPSKERKYDIINDNCATNTHDQMQFADMKLKEETIKTRRPGAVLDRAKEQSKQKKATKVISYKKRATSILQELRKQNVIQDAGFANYANLSSSRRYCSPDNENGLKKDLKAKVSKGKEPNGADPNVVSDPSVLVKEMDKIGKVGCAQGVAAGKRQEGDAKCKAAKKDAAEILNRITKCGQLEEAVLFDQKAKAAKELLDSREASSDKNGKKGKEKKKASTPMSAALATHEKKALQLDKLRADLAVKLGDLFLLAKAAFKSSEGREPKTQDEMLKAIDKAGQGEVGKALAAEIEALTAQASELKKPVMDSYSALMKDAPRPLELIEKYQRVLSENIMKSCCQAEPGTSQ